MTIKTMAFSMMHARSRQMTDPPHCEKETQEESIQAGEIRDSAGFQVPSSAFLVLKRGFHPHPQRIFSHASTTGRQIRDQQPGFLIERVPIGAHIGLQWFLLPHNG